VMLRWLPSPAGIEAVGIRGVYTISQRLWGKPWLLSAVGHDQLPLLAVGFPGLDFDTLDHAKDNATRIDRVKTVEPQVSGC
jgi:hypothetical protein